MLDMKKGEGKNTRRTHRCLVLAFVRAAVAPCALLKRRRLPVSTPWLPRPCVCQRLHDITFKATRPCASLPQFPLYVSPATPSVPPTSGATGKINGTNCDRDARGQVVLGGDPRNPCAGYFSTPIFYRSVFLLSERRTRRTNRVIVSSARTLETPGVLYGCHFDQAKWWLWTSQGSPGQFLGVEMECRHSF